MLKYISIVIEKIVNILIFVVILAILFCVYNIFSLKVLGNDYVNIFGYSFFEVATGSMSGSIEISDAVIVKIDEEYEVGDVVTYRSGNDFITHRVIEDSGDYIITKGDANSSADNPIDKGLVLGKVVHVFNNVGVWKSVLLTPKVIILVFATLFTFSILFAYNGKKIKISVNDDGTFVPDERMQKRRNRLKIKDLNLEYTQVIEEIPKENKISIFKEKFVNRISEIKEKIFDNFKVIKEKIFDRWNLYKEKFEKYKEECLEKERLAKLNKIENVSKKEKQMSVKESPKKSRNIDNKKKLEYTQIIKMDDLKEVNNKKKLEYTQAINIHDIKNQTKKKNLEYTQVININDIKKSDKKKNLEYTQVINLNKIGDHDEKKN